MGDPLFDAESLLASAADAAGTADLDVGPFAEHLSYLLAALGEEAGLYPARVWRTLDNLTEELVIRAARKRLLTEHLEIAQTEIKAPVFITGLPRTGTTVLHNLLARLPPFRAWKLWEMRAPLRFDDRSLKDIAADAQFQIDALYQRVPVFKKIHPLRADWPDECSWLMRHNFSSMVMAFQYYIPSYRKHLCQSDMHAAYADYRSWLQLLQSQNPGGRLILKDPCHLWHLDALLDTFPDATIIHLHRDPAESVPSLASLCYALHSMDSSQTDARRTGAETLAMVEAAQESMDRVRQARPEARFMDIPYLKIIANPLQVACDLAMELGESVAQTDLALAWLAENQQYRAGKHNYSPEMYGMRAEDLRERLSRV